MAVEDSTVYHTWGENAGAAPVLPNIGDTAPEDADFASPAGPPDGTVVLATVAGVTSIYVRVDGAWESVALA